ncbi:MAG: PocR ligand-binding domain-containing protein [Deltaproteobacteria bacterium]|nr:PocR ligand-binding domain-containing protein [Deltaproteobacteria bacterium]
MTPKGIRLLDLIKREKLDEVLQAFTQVSGIASIITDTDGHPITKSHNFTSFCQRYCRSTEMGREKCYASDSYGGAKSLELRQPYLYECLNAGLVDCALPIIVEGYHLANFLCGQVVEKPISVEAATRRARAIGIDDVEGYLDALNQVPRMKRERLVSIVTFMSVITQTISELALQKFMLDKQSRRYLNKLVNSVSDCIISLNADSHIVLANEACPRVFGYEVEEMRGKSFLELLSDPSPFEHYQCEIATRDGNRGRLELTGLRKDRQTFPAQVSLARIGSDTEENVSYVAVFRDISEEKKIERMKEDLVGMLTHDMANPVLSIQKAIQILLNEDLGFVNDEQREVMELALSTSRQLHGMVAEFLDIYRSENGRFLLRKHAFDLNEVICESMGHLRFLAEEKSIGVRFDGPVEPLKVVGDRERVKRICVNLLANSINYSLRGGHIFVSAKRVGGGSGELAATFGQNVSQRLPAVGTYVLTSVRDEGFGIPDKYQEAVFEKFFTTKSEDQDVRRGLGLGLAFCKLVAEAHGGAICARTPRPVASSQKTPGCEIHLILPAGQSCDARDPS